MAQQAEQGVFLTAAEAITPVGLNMASTAAAMRAGVSGFGDWEGYAPIQNEFDDTEELVTAARVGGIEEMDSERLVQLMTPPLQRLIENAGLSRQAWQSGGIYFALPFKDEFMAELDLQKTVLEIVMKRLGLPKAKEFGGVQTGSTGVPILIDRAMSKMSGSELEFALIVAVDSYLIGGRLSSYDKAWRVKSNRNPAGFIPGESAALILIENESYAKGRNARPIARLGGVATGMEPNALGGELSSTGRGLADAIRAAAELKADPSPWNWVCSDFNGERYFAYEWGVASTRLHQVISPGHRFQVPAESVGNAGAASVALQLGCIAQAFERGYAVADHALVLAADDAQARYAMAVSRVDGTGAN